MEHCWNNTELGNFWSDWNAPDSDNNGIVDQPYSIDENRNNIDNFPLVKPIFEFLPIARVEDNITINQHEMVILDGLHSIGLLCNLTWKFTYDDSLVILFELITSFTFHLPVTYIVTLIVTDIIGRSDTVSINVTVIDTTPPMADAGKDIMIAHHRTVQFNASDSWDNVGILNYTWTFLYRTIDTTLHGNTASFTFDDIGEYIITLNVIDAVGNLATDTFNVTVLDITPPTVEIGEDVIVQTGENIIFNGSGSRDDINIVVYTWTFTYDNTEYELYGINQSFTFNIPGTYVITLTVYDKVGNYARDNLTITVLDSSKLIDSDGDTFNNTYELASGSDPFNFISVPSDRDGDGHPNGEDAYPDDPARWKWEPDDEIPPGDGDDTWGDVRSRYVWAGIGLLSVLIALVTMIVHFLRGRKEDIRRDEEDDDGLGRVPSDEMK